MFAQTGKTTPNVNIIVLRNCTTISFSDVPKLHIAVWYSVTVRRKFFSHPVVKMEERSERRHGKERKKKGKMNRVV